MKAGAWLSLPSSEYRRYHDVTLPTASGTTQIDHLFRVGVRGFRGGNQEHEWVDIWHGKGQKMDQVFPWGAEIQVPEPAPAELWACEGDRKCPRRNGIGERSGEIGCRIRG